MKTYDEYKNSGTEWLGNIPKHWNLKRLKDVSNLKFSNVDKKIKIGQQNITLCNYTDVYKNEFIDDSINFMVSTASFEEIKKFSLKKGDILTTKDSESFDDIANPAMVIKYLEGVVCGYHLSFIRPDKAKMDSKYLFRLFQSTHYNYWFRINAKGITRVGVGIQSYFNANTPTPPIKEQTQIADYLDNKTQAIDKKIDLLGQKVNKFKELKKSLINQTITKGLNPNVKFKNSGIDWIGEIPEHWEFKRMKDVGFLFSGLSGKSGSDFNQDDNLNNKSFLPFTNIASNTYINTNKFGKVIIHKGEKQNEIKKNDLFFLMSSEGYEDIGKAALLIDDVSETYLNSFCKGFRITDKKVEPKFLNWLLFSSAYREKLLVQGKGFTRINLKMDKINDFGFFIPKIRSEQTQIANYLDDKTKHIDNIINNVEDQIAVLTELRKTLINDVVTGKIKVTA